jgi:V8-like Glu-specific endopeptidase
MAFLPQAPGKLMAAALLLGSWGMVAGCSGCEGGFFTEGIPTDAAWDPQVDTDIFIPPDTVDGTDIPAEVDGTIPNRDECGDIKPGSPIVNGVTDNDPTVVNLTAGQKAAIGAILVNGGMAMCTATVIAPDTVLSAAHCFDYGASSVDFYVGTDIRSPTAVLSASEWHLNPQYGSTYESPPQYDNSIIILGESTASAGITPIPVNCTTTSIYGQRVQAVGFGMTSAYDDSNTRRWWTVLTCDYEGSFVYGVTGNGATGACYGDSGGPLLVTKGDGLIYEMGDLSVGDSDDCLGHDYYARTDYNCGFIQDYVTPDPCAGETLQGRCSGNTAIWCEASTVRQVDCAASGQVCGLDGSSNYRCLTPADPCNGETLQGRCDGNTAIWCEGSAVQTVPCASGTMCADSGGGLFRCVDECSLIGMQGRCDGTTARWCEGGVIKSRDCALCSQTCGWINSTVGYYCL